MVSSSGIGLILALSAVISVGVLIIFIGLPAKILQTSCWRNTVEDLEYLLEPFQLGVGKCLGKDSFTINLTISSCVEKIGFTDYIGCLRACQKIDTDKTHVTRGECSDACLKCRYSKGCILAVPRTEGEYFPNVLEALDKIRSTKLNKVMTQPTDYGFIGTQEYPEVGKETGQMCLNFKKNGDIYSISSKIVPSFDTCEVTQCL